MSTVVSVDLKAVTKLEDVHLAHGINYLEGYNLEVVLLINFGARSLQYERIVNGTFKQQMPTDLNSILQEVKR